MPIVHPPFKWHPWRLLGIGIGADPAQLLGVGCVGVVGGDPLLFLRVGVVGAMEKCLRLSCGSCPSWRKTTTRHGCVPLILAKAVPPAAALDIAGEGVRCGHGVRV